jgi:hypothetical protein
MVPTQQAAPNCSSQTLRNRLFVPVPWERADSLRNRLHERGIPAIACYDPAEHAAGLEILREMDYNTIQSILAACPQ